MENNEAFEECAKREVLEETGLDEMTFRPIYLIGGSSNIIHYADIIFYASHNKGEPIVKETNRVEKWEWFNVFKLPSPLYRPTELALKHFVSNYQIHMMNLFLQRWIPGKRVSILYVDAVNL